MKFALTTLTLAAALGLAACAEAEAPDAELPAETGDTTIINEAPEPTTVEAVEDEGSSLTIDGADVDATISEDGVQAEVNVDE